MPIKLISSLLIWLLLCFGTACNAQDYSETDKIAIYFGKADNQAAYVAELEKNFYIGMKFSIDNITEIEINDVSSSSLKCTSDILTSPSKIAKFTTDPTANFKQLEFRIDLPCAAYHEQWDVMVKLKTQRGNYYVKQRLPVKISFEGPGYVEGEYQYSGKLPVK